MDLRRSSQSSRSRARRVLQLAACLAAVAPATASAAAGPLTASPNPLDFGAQQTATTSTTRTVTITNSGDAGTTINSAVPSAEFTRVTPPTGPECVDGYALAAGANCTIGLRFTPSANGARTGTLTVNATGATGNPLVVQLRGTGTPQLTSSPSTLDFGTQDINAGPTGSQTSNVTNNGTTPVTLNSVFLTSDAGQFLLNFGTNGDNTCRNGTTLNPGDFCRVVARFDPSSFGQKFAVVNVGATNNASTTVNLQGFGSGAALSSDPGFLAFGNRDVDAGPSAVSEARINNNGSDQVYLNGVSLTGDTTEFERLTGLGTDCAAGNTILPGNFCIVRVRFDPTTVGSKSALVSVFGNTNTNGFNNGFNNASTSVSLSGTGARSTLSATPADIAFGERQVNTGGSGERRAVVTNTGTQAVTLDRATLERDNGQFSLLNDLGDDCTVGKVLAPNATCGVRVRFVPNSEGAKSATVRVGVGAVQVTVNLTGTGTAAPASTPPASAPPASTPPTAAPPASTPPTLAPKDTSWLLVKRNDVLVSFSSRGTLVATGYAAMCPTGGSTCTGRVTLSIRRRSKDTGRIITVFLHAKVRDRAISPGAEQRLFFRLSRSGARRLRSAGVLSATLRGAIQTGNGPVITRTASVEIVAPDKKT